MFGSGITIVIISNEDMNGIMNIVKSLKEYDLSIKDVSKMFQNEAKEQKSRFLSMLLGTLGASLLGDILTVKSKIRTGEGTIWAGQNKITFNSVYSRNNLPRWCISNESWWL